MVCFGLVILDSSVSFSCAFAEARRILGLPAPQILTFMKRHDKTKHHTTALIKSCISLYDTMREDSQIKLLDIWTTLCIFKLNHDIVKQ